MNRKIIFPIVFAICCLMALQAYSQGSENYTGKTYLFLGNSFVERFDSKIDTSNFTSEIQIRDGKIIRRYYPKYQGELERTEIYHYTELEKLAKIVVATKSRYMNRPKLDSTVYHYKKEFGEYDIEVKVYGDVSVEHYYTIIGDTSYIDEYINANYAYTVREIKKGDKIKERQIIKPELSEVINTFYYDDFGNELKYEKTENGKTEVTMSFVYEYDHFNRITRRQTFFEPEHELMSLEIRIYD